MIKNPIKKKQKVKATRNNPSLINLNIYYDIS